MARGDQLVRQWSILHSLKEGPKTRRFLAQEFGVSRKTITRDIDDLSFFPILEEQDGIDIIYRLMEDYQAPGIQFQPEEVMALLFAKEHLAISLKQTSFEEAFHQAIHKLEKTQRGQGHRKIERFPFIFQIESPQPEGHHHKIQKEIYQELIQAALESKQIWMRYFTVSRQEMTKRRVEPHVLYQSSRGLLLIAFCHLRNDFLYFSVEQIQELRVLEQRFDPNHRKFDLEEFWKLGFDGIRSAPILDVELFIRYPSATFLKHQQLHPTQEVEEKADGLLFRFSSGGKAAILAKILSFGEDCTVLSPPELVEEVRQKIENMKKLYHKD